MCVRKDCSRRERSIEESWFNSRESKIASARQVGFSVVARTEGGREDGGNRKMRPQSPKEGKGKQWERRNGGENSRRGEKEGGEEKQGEERGGGYAAYVCTSSEAVEFGQN